MATSKLVDLATAVDKLRAWASQQPLVACLVLYGSLAKGSKHPTDIDIAIGVRAPDPEKFDSCEVAQEWYFNDSHSRWRCELEHLLNFKPVHVQKLAPDLTLNRK